MKRALIIGSAGQDGSYLSEQLAAAGWSVVGVDRATPRRVALDDATAVAALVREVAPEALFHLAAYHHSSEDAARPLGPELLESEALHVTAWVHLLEAVAAHAPNCRSFYAASSHVFGAPRTPLIDESHPFSPTSAYAITKAAGVEVGRLYRARGLHVSAGFLFNHESPRRPTRFVSQKIVRAAVAAAHAKGRGEAFLLELGSLSAVVDWGYAPDYTNAMLRIVTCDEPADYVIATGTPHTPADLCREAFHAVGLDWTEFVRERPGAVTRQLPALLGDASALRKATGWAPTVSFETMVRSMVIAAQQQERESE